MADEDESLSDILSSAEPKGETAAPPAATEQASDNAGKFAKVEEPAKDSPKAEGEPAKAVDPRPEDKPAEKPRIDVAALIDERRRRQAAEARVKELEGQKPEKAPSVFEDEDKAIGHRVDSGTRSLRESLFNQSVKIAQLVHKEDYEEVSKAFLDASDKDERLIEALRRAEDPGEFIYTTGLQLKEMGDVGGDFVKYREKLTGDLRTQLTERDAKIATLEKQIADLAAAQAELSTLPKSLNTRSAAPKAGEVEPDEDISSIARFNQRKTG
jgi:hypothetical protein